MRRAARVDANHHAIVQCLRSVGAHVESLAAVGGGIPDLLVGFRGRNWLLEVKDGRRPPSERRLNPAQQAWHAVWAGHVVVVRSPEEALRAIGISVEARTGNGGAT